MVIWYKHNKKTKETQWTKPTTSDDTANVSSSNIAKNVDTDAETKDLINKLDDYSLSSGRSINITLIKKALPNMFLYLKDDKIPNTTNSLESFFGHLKGNLKNLIQCHE